MKELTARLTRSLKSRNASAIAVGIVYLWFGALKFFPGVSPAESLAKETLTYLTLGFLSEGFSLLLLALLEVTIGLLLITGWFRRRALQIAVGHILLTFTPMLFSPELVFSEVPFGLTLLGQYIVKNVIIFSVLLLLLNQQKEA
ncbi:doxx family protein [Poritiphilus flavus]|uniref:Doxx family protein n=1 Tax=Poritiphilus flavus TaxID=2697053 RepID=A0A6L9EAY0_9FLAO|nr:doxx family protein [Poritiphilus flavus]NAS11915.1 doxx family protein [Poritiphilus flavus]